ncbi:hypothetical protein ACFLX5_04170 [Chloroflexota bacterium]
MPDIRPYLITDQDATGRMLIPLPSKDRVFQEEWLQELLFKHPSILPVAELDEAYAPPISLGRVIANIDNLFISPSGLLTIVETKLWRNPEAHRTVVAQILDYAKTLTAWNYDRLDDTVKSYTAKRLGQPKSIYQLVKAKAHDLDMNEIEYKQRVQDGLINGRFALLIVGDRIFPAATQLAEIIQSAPHLQFTMGFVELRCHKLEKDSDWPLVVIPSIVSRTSEVTRAVVRVLYEEKRPDIEVSTIEEHPPIGSTSFPEFTASLPSNISDLFRSYLESWIKTGYTVFWGKVGFSLRIPWKGKLVTVFDAYPDSASIFQDKRVKEHGLPLQEYQQYRMVLMESASLASAFAAGRRYIRYDHLSEEEVKLLLESTDELARAWFETQSDVP